MPGMAELVHADHRTPYPLFFYVFSLRFGDRFLTNRRKLSSSFCRQVRRENMRIASPEGSNLHLILTFLGQSWFSTSVSLISMGYFMEDLSFQFVSATTSISTFAASFANLTICTQVLTGNGSLTHSPQILSTVLKNVSREISHLSFSSSTRSSYNHIYDTNHILPFRTSQNWNLLHISHIHQKYPSLNYLIQSTPTRL